MSFPPAVTSVYCPGCAPGDFPQSHICGLSTSTYDLSFKWCSRCNVQWKGSHICWTTTTVPSIATIAPLFSEPAHPVCDHCWCQKQKAGHYNVPTPSEPYRTSDSRFLKPHQVCCNCGNRRVKP